MLTYTESMHAEYDIPTIESNPSVSKEQRAEWKRNADDRKRTRKQARRDKRDMLKAFEW